MTTPNQFTSSAPAQSYTAVNGGMDGTGQTEGQALFQQASQSHQPDVLVKCQFEQRNQNQKSKLANEFVASAGRDGVSQLAATPDGQHALAVVYDHAGSDGRGLMRQVHEEQGSTAVDYTPESGLVCTAQAAQQGEKALEEQYLDKLMKQYADHTSGEMSLPPSESLGLRSEIERVSEIVNPGQQNMWGEYTPQEKQYLDEQALRERQAANNLGMWVGGPVFSAMPATARLLGAPEPVVEGFGQINAEIAGGKAFGRQGRGIEPVRVPISGGPVKTYMSGENSVRIEPPRPIVRSSTTITGSVDHSHEAVQAKRFGDLHGGGTVDFGNNTPGIEGYFIKGGTEIQVPFSLKDLSGAGKIKNVFREIKSNARQIQKHEALPQNDPMSLPVGTSKQAIIHVNTPQFSAKEMLDFVSSSNPNIFQPNVFKEIIIDTKTGIVLIDSSKKVTIRN